MNNSRKPLSRKGIVWLIVSGFLFIPILSIAAFLVFGNMWDGYKGLQAAPSEKFFNLISFYMVFTGPIFGLFTFLAYFGVSEEYRKISWRGISIIALISIATTVIFFKIVS